MQNQSAQLSAEEESKDAFFQELAQLSENMVAAHGKDFSMGALLMAVRWIAEGKLQSQGAE
ncbi:hypothetical protein QM467_07075 [Rhodoblastus sp. 17X3]|uniref:hypothetical protein n=1 Tax=Rhodoblastus sp. 17X3 TaxID=3047026 RepID=UPI0024B69755|nr:hypothetical protein [Rhodoblastus sp. 17X3]MDI9847814.1 hypothetical protein [Rhodoblastus sp. 17X3]